MPEEVTGIGAHENAFIISIICLLKNPFDLIY